MKLITTIACTALMCLAGSCDRFPVVSLKLNDAQKYKVNTDCGTLTITADVLLFSERTKVLGIELEADQLKAFSINRENLHLYSDSGEIPQEKQYLDGTKTKMSVNFTVTDTIQGPMSLYLTADNFILCNGKSLVSDTLKIKLADTL